uniref:Carbohydrate kinase FGGY N-terminal domain-containing protein n=1 Tax=Pavo cristatus TaxID=9049 RepID=A0A8C9FZ32_PAVCR
NKRLLGAAPALYVVGVDVGSTAVKCHVYDRAAAVRGSSCRKVESLYPRPGWVELDPEVLWSQFVGVIKEAVQAAGLHMRQVAALGISTQRSTFITWHKYVCNCCFGALEEINTYWSNLMILKVFSNLYAFFY